MLRLIGFILFFFGIVPIVVYGEFDNEFLRLSILFISITCSVYSYLSWMLRILAIVINVFVVLIMEIPYLRELLL